MTKKVFTFFILIISFLGEIKSQADFQRNSLDLLPPSPNSSELIRIIEAPIDEFTGQMKTNIPIYTLEDRDLKIPINLTYNSNGIKVNQMSSWVGLGWSLEAGGVITRIVRGNPDDLYDINGDIHAYGMFYFADRIAIMNGNDTNLKINNSVAYGEGTFENDPDIFYFNIPGYSGKFFFDTDRNIHLVPKQNLIIEYSQIGNDPITSFTITTPDGYKCYFTETESIETNLPNDNLFYSSWNLKKITTAHNSDIEFYYSREDILEKNAPSELQIYNDNQWRNWNRTSVIPEIRYHCKRLNKITWIGGEIVFEATHLRTDVSKHPSDIYSAYALTGIRVKDKYGDIVKNYNFSYSYFDSSNGIVADKYLYKRLKLDSFMENETEGLLQNTYEFTYNSYPLPSRNSKEQDFWGYYNDNNASTLVPNLFFYASSSLSNIYPSQYSIFRRYNSGTTEYVINVGADRNVNEVALKAGILTEMTYPTNGKIRFTYQPNMFRFENRDVTGGGLRIVKIEHVDNNNLVEKTIEYEYIDPATGYCSGIIPTLPVFAFQRTKRGSTIVNQTDLYSKTFFTVNSLTDLDVFNGCNVVYEFVRKKESGNGSVLKKFDIPEIRANEIVLNYSDSKILSLPRSTPVNYGAKYAEYIQYNFGNPYNHYSSAIAIKDLYPYVSVANIMWGMGQLLEEWIYKEGSLTTPLKKIEYKYDIVDIDILGAFRMDFSDMNTETRQSFFYPGEYINMIFNYFNRADYMNVSAIKRMIERKEITNYGGVSTTQKTEYSYNSKGFLSQETTYDSYGGIVKTQYMYPFNYTWGSTSLYSSAALIFKTMVERNIINDPIEITSFKDNKVIRSNLHMFKEENNIVVPDKKYVLDIIAPISMPLQGLSYTNWSSATNTVTFNKSSYYKEAQQFLKHDSIGNLTAYQNRGGVSASFHWGYNYQYPVVRAENIDYETLNSNITTVLQTHFGAQSFETFLNSLSDLRTSTNKTSWHLFNSELRKLAPSSEKLITTYTYKPLVGITSQTDPTGLTTYYEYDTFGRLSLIRDHNNQILKKYDYHYAGQSAGN